jgi:hypothetical protein
VYDTLYDKINLVFFATLVSIYVYYFCRTLAISQGYMEAKDKGWYWKVYLPLFAHFDYKKRDPSLHLSWLFFRRVSRVSIGFCTGVFSGNFTL